MSMFDSLYVQFAQLPDEMRAAVTSREAMEMLDVLEKKYHLPLGEIVLRVMVGELSLAVLPAFLRDTEHMEGGSVDALTEELREGLLHPVLQQLEERAAKLPQQTRQPSVSKKESSPPASLPVVSQSVQPRAVLQYAPTDLVAPVRERLRVLQHVAPPSTPAPLPRPGQSPTTTPAVQQETRRPVAAYFVHAEDEAEIEKHRERLRNAGTSPTDDLENVITRLQEQHHISLASPNLQKRFHMILLSRLRDVRDAAGMRDLLARPEKIGGLALPPAVADALALDVEAAIRTIHERALQTPSAPASLPPALPSAMPPSEMTALPLDNEEVTMAREQQRIDAAPAPISPSIHTSVSPPLPPVVASPREQPPVPEQPTVVRRTVAQNMDGRQIMQDVKYPVRPMSLVDELEVLTLEDFRSPNRTTVQTAQKILEKIGLLTEESYTKRAQGVGAWRHSQVYQLYLAMGRDSMDQGMPIERVVEKRQHAGQPFLTPDEFSIVADLNRQLST